MTSTSSQLTVTVWDNPDAAPRTWELTADPPGGTHPDPAGAVAAIDAAPNAFDPVPADAICAQLYGGPERAEIEGSWRGRAVSASYDKKNSCEIARWNALSAVLDP